ncbi:MAG: hypothetical protein EXR99_16455 [Gemmataceae bacterium]|nr:hypothetical protein [Gemmataceae bacterium]
MRRFTFLFQAANAGIVFLSLAGCGQQEAPPPAEVKKSIQVAPSGPSEMELSQPKAYFRDAKTVMFELKYRFTKGKPDKYYLCEITFPGTPFQGAKPMESWELKGEGSIKDGLILSKLEGKLQEFEIRVSEAVSPQNGYKLISNVLKGKVE